jgi:succinate dehydrogenase flavin-adding protein (antitoxin of CptAB toxin-antitoxin module)
VEDAELIKSVARQEQEPLMTTEERKAANKKLGYAQVDELREALRENGGLLRLPADDLSDFDSDEYFRELEESDEDTFTPINNTNNKTAPNKPQMIEVIRLNKRTGLPSHKPTVTTPPPTSSDPESDPDPKVNLGASRKRGETAEEKKARKAAVKTARMERRGEKKENKMIFKQ